MADWPFVGRQTEQERVIFLLRGRPPLSIVLAGSQGVGKTRLALATRAWAEANGFQVRHAAASSATTSIPFGALAAMLPVLRDVPDSPQATFQAAADHLLSEAGDGKLLISVDDAQHLDEASAGLLHQLTPSPAVSVLLTLRTDLPAPDAVHAIWRSGLAERLDLGPLDQAGVEGVLDEALEGRVAPGTVAELARLSAGNPLYLRELVSGSLASGTLSQVDGLWHLRERATTPRLIDIVEERLRGLDHEQRRALELLATAGGLGYDPLVALVGEAAVEDLERAGLLTVTQDRRRRQAAVGHPVHGDVVLAAMTTAQSARSHGQIADAIEAAGARRRDDVLRVAVARLASGGDVSPPLMAEAARRALAASDLGLSERLGRIAVEAGAGFTAELDLGITLTRAGRQPEADRIFAAIDTTDASDAERAQLANEWADCLFWGMDELDRARATVAAAATTVTDPAWLEQLTVSGASYEMLAGHPDIAVEALEGIRTGGTPRGVAAAGLILGTSLTMLGRSDEALAALAQAWAARDEIDEGFGLVHDGMLVAGECIALDELGQVVEAHERGAKGHAAAVVAGDYSQAWLAMNTGRTCRFTRRLADVDRWALEGAAAFEALGIAAARRWCLYGAAWALALRGDRAGAHRLIEQARAIEPGHIRMMEPETRRAEAAIAVLEGDRGEAIRILNDGADLAEKLALRTQEVGALHDLVRLGEAGEIADRLLARAAEVDGGLAATIAVQCRGVVADDGDLLADASDRFAALGIELFAAEAAAQASGAYHNAMDRRRAQRWADRAAELVAVIGPVDTPALRLGGGSAELTAREREIAELAAKRIPSKEIAQRLSVSRRTVDNHLHRIYAKLAVTGRDELAEALGLTQH